MTFYNQVALQLMKRKRKQETESIFLEILSEYVIY